MKRLFLILVLFLISCTPMMTNQQVIEKPNLTVTQKNVSINITKLLNTTKINTTEPANKVITRSVNGTKHTIEVIGVTEDSKSCLLKVDGSTYVVDKDTTQKINGIRITVLDVRTFHDVLDNNDLCQLFIS